MSLAPRIPRATIQHVRRERPGMSNQYLALIRQLPCLSCGMTPPEGSIYRITPHHLMRVGHGANTRGMSFKNADQWAVPACFSPTRSNCHDKVQDASGREEEWYAVRGIDARAEARALWAARDEGLPAMRRIVDRARAGAALKARKT